MEAERLGAPRTAMTARTRSGASGRPARAPKLADDWRRLVFDGCCDGMTMIRPDGSIAAVNRAQAAMCGFASPDDLVGAPAAESVAPSSRSAAEQAIARALSGEEVALAEYELVRRDGTTFWGETTATALRGGDGAVTGLIWATRDITGRRRSETALRESEEHYRAVVDRAREGIYRTTDISERKRAEDLLRQSEKRYQLMFGSAPLAINVTRGTEVIYANPAYLDMFGLASLEEMKDLPPLELFAPEWRPRVVENIGRRAEGLPVPTAYEAVCLRRDGARFPILLQFARVGLVDGPATVAFLTDITELKRAQEELRARDRQFRAFIEQAPLAITVSRHGVLLYANQKLAEMLGLGDVEALVGEPAHALFAPSAREESKERTRRRSLGLPVPTEFESVFERADGSQFPAHFAVGTVHLADGPAHIAFIADVTERRAAERALLAAKAMRDVAERVARVGSWRLDAITGKYEVSDVVYELFDVRRGEFGGDGRAMLRARIHADDLNQYERARATAAEGRGPVPVEFRVVHRDGTEHVLHVEAEAKADETGKVTTLTGYCQDVTAQRQAETRLRAAVAEWSETFDAMVDSVTIFGPKGRIVRANTATMVLTGLVMADIVGHFCSEVFHLPGDVECAWHRAFETKRAETTIMQRAGKWLRSTFTPQLDAAGEVCAGINVITDITELRDAEQQLSTYAAQLKFNLAGAVAAFGATTELRDPYTAGHQRRVAELACAIARELGWDEERTGLLRTAALLHDIGKIMVPAEILSRPGRLSEVEMQILRMHPGVGGDIVAPIGFAPEVAEMVRQHHERPDGSGYPAGLRGERILPEARILAVADVVEAMVSHRPYRPALPVEAALAEVTDGAATRYDAAVCAAAVSLITERRFDFSQFETK
jgi:PAS domain S-box-containing protein/putative nucleotidyltransferase with HDIG domain